MGAAGACSRWYRLPRAQKGVMRAKWGGEVQAARRGSTLGCGGSVDMLVTFGMVGVGEWLGWW